MDNDAMGEVRQWAQSEIASCVAVDSRELANQLRLLNARHSSVYIVEINGSRARLRYKSTQIPALRARAEIYLRHIRETLSHQQIKIETCIALDVDDLAAEYLECPVFSFQRKIGTRNPLMPDLDTIDYRHYSGQEWALPDDLCYNKKRDTAIFAGSTTGGGHIDATKLACPFPRLRAARFFKGSSIVDFRLPSIVQTGGPEIVAQLRAEGFGTGAISWREQMKSKFLISMDGNGAALSRPYVALASNSVLIKYASEYEAFYFSRLVPDYHFLLAKQDEDVLSILDADTRRYAAVAEQGKDFVSRFLSPSMYEMYTAALLMAFAERYSFTRHAKGNDAMLTNNKTGSVMPHGPHTGVVYTDFIPQICLQREARTYLEVGVQAGINLARISVDKAIGVDPAFRLSVDPTVGKRSLELHRMGSDAFFAKTEVEDIDLAFLDGMHKFEFLLRDFYNTEARSKSNGLIMMHDCMPFDANMVARLDTGGAWTGDVWKTVMILQKYRPDLSVICLDCAPTGLVCVTNLDPLSTVLHDKYCEIVREFSEISNDQAGIDEFYNSIDVVSAAEILADYNHTLYFRL